MHRRQIVVHLCVDVRVHLLNQRREHVELAG